MSEADKVFSIEVFIGDDLNDDLSIYTEGGFEGEMPDVDKVVILTLALKSIVRKLDAVSRGLKM